MIIDEFAATINVINFSLLRPYIAVRANPANQVPIMHAIIQSNSDNALLSEVSDCELYNSTDVARHVRIFI